MSPSIASPPISSWPFHGNGDYYAKAKQTLLTTFTPDGPAKMQRGEVEAGVDRRLTRLLAQQSAAMAEVLYYAIPFFVLLLVLEYLSFRQVRAENEGLIGYDARDTRTSLTMGFGNVVINFGWKFVVLAAYIGIYELTPAAPRPRRLVGLGAALLRRRLLLLLVPPHLPREPRLLGEPRGPPLERALQPLDCAAPDLGADDLLPVLAAAAAASASRRGWCCSRRPGR